MSFIKNLIKLSIFIFFIWFSFAQESNLSWNENIFCIQDKYEIKWDFDIKVWNSIELFPQIKQEILVDSEKTIVYKLYDNSKIIETYTWLKYIHKFISPWSFLLNINIKQSNWCEYNIENNINIYKKIYIYIWDQLDDFNLWFDDSFYKQNILFKKIFLDSNSSFKDNFLQDIDNNFIYFKNVDKIIINSSEFSKILEVLWKFSKLYSINLKDKSIYVVETINKHLFRTIILKYLKLIWIEKIYHIDWDMFLNFLRDISFDKKIENISILSVSLSDISQPYYFLSYIVDFLIYNDISISFLWFILSLSVCVLIISIFRQIIWFSVFGVYGPVLFSMNMFFVWIKFSIIVLLIAFLATFLIRYFTNKIYLLYSAKISMLFIVYLMCFIFMIWVDKYFWFNMIDYSIFSNSLIIFPIILMIIVSNKILWEWFSFKSSAWWFSFIEFIIVSLIIYMIMSWISFQYFLITYPSIMFFILFMNVLVWRFSWLQLLEYIRFWPLIRKQYEEEEE